MEANKTQFGNNVSLTEKPKLKILSVTQKQKDFITHRHLLKRETMFKKRHNGPKMDSLVLSPTSANQDLIPNLITVSAFPRNVNFNQSI